MEAADSHPTLAHRLQWCAERDPQRCAYIFLADGETETARLTYFELDQHARVIASQLESSGARGERALLIYPSGSDFVAALFGCFYAGVVAVPAIPEQSPRAIERFRKIIFDCQASLVLTTEAMFKSVQRALVETAEFGSLRWVVTDKPATHPSLIRAPLFDDADDLAFIQYTSGSTSDPKGISVSHANLVYNQRMFQAGLKTNQDTRIVTWLPIYHDLGLIGQLLHGLFVGGLCILMPPFAFLQEPIRWLQAITKYQASYSAAPNFGYEHCLNKIRDKDCNKLDLRFWTRAMNAAEPVRHSTIREFESRFAPYGFSPRAFFPAYGLAEATVCVSGGPSDRGATSLAVDSDAIAQHHVDVVELGASNARSLVACGEKQLDEEIVIVDPDSRTPLPPDRVGEIWVRGPNIAKGYWNRPSETVATFCARLSDTGDGPFLRTGDLGFLRDRQLYITGRMKDVIIIRGRNHYPQDIELTVEQSHPDVRPGCCAAFSESQTDGDRLILLVEIRISESINHFAIAAAIRQEVASKHGIAPQSIALVVPRTVLKTSSGKVARSACRDGYCRRTLPIEYEGNGLLDQ
jgi:acyl-CoA synthetase (AMP-forming)/AMP-acid ligase II